MSKKEIARNKRLVAIIRSIAKEVCYEILDEHLEEKHKRKSATEEELDSL